MSYRVVWDYLNSYEHANSFNKLGTIRVASKNVLRKLRHGKSNISKEHKLNRVDSEQSYIKIQKNIQKTIQKQRERPSKKASKVFLE